MRIDLSKLPDDYNDFDFKPDENSTKAKDEYKFYGEIESLRNSIKLSKDRVGWMDSFSTYYINKDGSGQVHTAWGKKTYPKDTFNKVVEAANEIYANTRRNRFDNDDTSRLIDMAEKLIKTQQ